MSTSHTDVKCTTCETDCSAHHWMCDMRDGAWCGPCFSKTPCGKGRHGDGCSTQVFDDGEAVTDDLRLSEKP